MNLIIANLQNTEKKDPDMLSMVVQSCNLRTRRLRQEDHGFKATYTECILKWKRHFVVLEWAFQGHHEQKYQQLQYLNVSCAYFCTHPCSTRSCSFLISYFEIFRGFLLPFTEWSLKLILLKFKFNLKTCSFKQEDRHVFKRGQDVLVKKVERDKRCTQSPTVITSCQSYPCLSLFFS